MEAFLLGFLLLSLGFWFMAIIDLTRSRFRKPILRTVWLLIILFFPILGSLAYFIFKSELILDRRRKFEPKFNR